MVCKLSRNINTENRLINYDLMFDIATLYYRENLTQESISRRLRISKYKVHRLLKKAKDIGVVQIDIIGPENKL